MFLSTTTNGVDAKGRVSVPADFRAVVAGEPGIYVWKSFNGGMLDGGGQRRMSELQDAIDAMDPYDDNRMLFERVIFGGAKLLTFDGNGRVSLPAEFIAHAGLEKKATFVGLGRRFEIWSPEAYEAAQAEALEFARANRAALRKPAQPGEGA